MIGQALRTLASVAQFAVTKGSCSPHNDKLSRGRVDVGECVEALVVAAAVGVSDVGGCVEAPVVAAAVDVSTQVPHIILQCSLSVACKGYVSSWQLSLSFSSQSLGKSSTPLHVAAVVVGGAAVAARSLVVADSVCEVVATEDSGAVVGVVSPVVAVRVVGTHVPHKMGQSVL